MTKCHFMTKLVVEIGGFPKQAMQPRLTDITLKTPSPATIKIHPIALLKILVFYAYKL